MLRSRMFTPGFKLFFGIAGFLFLGALIFGMSSSLQVEGTSPSDQLSSHGIIQTVTGPVTLGWKGPVGNHLGYSVLLGAAAIAGFVAIVLVAFRDADPEAEAQLLQVETVPLTKAPSGTNFAPIVASFSLGIIALGWVMDSVLFYAGIALLVITIGTWTVRAWAERATGDDEVNRQIYARLIDPLRVPVVGALLVAFVVLGLSRLLLAVPKTWSAIIFGGAALLFGLGAYAIYLSPRRAKPLATGLLVLGAFAILGGAIFGIVKGERPIHHETTADHVNETEGSGPGGNQAPGAPAAQQPAGEH